MYVLFIIKMGQFSSIGEQISPLTSPPEYYSIKKITHCLKRRPYMIKTPIPPNVPMITHIQTQVMRAVVAVGPYDSQSGQIGVHMLLKSSQ